jgi:uncharacterized protein (DUF427 family)
VTPESANVDRDYPQMAAGRGRVEPAPRRVRAYAGGALALDTVHARYVWENDYYPQYYVPLADVGEEFLGAAEHTPHDGPLAGTVRLDWDAFDWFEEDEHIVGGHPRSPYVRVDALRSHRHVRVELDGAVLAETLTPVLLFETGLPTRYYLDRTDVDFAHLVESTTETQCPYKGTTSSYWSVRVGADVHPDLAWSYQFPLPDVAAVAGLVAFYNEKLDITVDGIALTRPRTHF